MRMLVPNSPASRVAPCAGVESLELMIYAAREIAALGDHQSSKIVQMTLILKENRSDCDSGRRGFESHQPPH